MHGPGNASGGSSRADASHRRTAKKYVPFSPVVVTSTTSPSPTPDDGVTVTA
jgi:hypothetical protein